MLVAGNLILWAPRSDISHLGSTELITLPPPLSCLAPSASPPSLPISSLSHSFPAFLSACLPALPRLAVCLPVCLPKVGAYESGEMTLEQFGRLLDIVQQASQDNTRQDKAVKWLGHS